MPLALFRVDDRLVHGQVVIGWGRPLGARAIVLVDDTVATSGWEQDLYRMAAPEGVEIVFASTTEAVERMAAWQADPRPIILLTGDLQTMAALRALPVAPSDPAMRARQRDSILTAFGVTAAQVESTSVRLAGDPAKAAEIWRAIETSPRTRP